MKNLTILSLLIFIFNTAQGHFITSSDSLEYLLVAKESVSKKTPKYELLVLEAQKHLGVPYKFGGCTNSGFDCSGFVFYVYAKFDITLPRTSTEQASAGRRVGKRKLRKGDLIFFRGSNAKKRAIGHVGIVISNKKEPVQFIHASTSRGIVVSTLETEYYKTRYRKARRLRELKKKV